MNIESILVRRLDICISILGNTLILLSALFLFVVTISGASGTFIVGPPLLLIEFFTAAVLLSTRAPALFRHVPRWVTFIHALVVLLNIPLVLLLGFFSISRRVGESAWGAERIVAPALLILMFGVCITILGVMISYIISETEERR